MKNLFIATLILLISSNAFAEDSKPVVISVEKAFLQTIVLPRNAACAGLGLEMENRQYFCSIDLSQYFTNSNLGTVMSLAPNSKLAIGVSDKNEYVQFKIKGNTIHVCAPKISESTTIHRQDLIDSSQEQITAALNSTTLTVKFLGPVLKEK